MKLLIAACTLFMTTSIDVNAGQFLWNEGEGLAVGQGQTIDGAEADARQAIPTGWQEDINNSPTLDCEFLSTAADGSYCAPPHAQSKFKLSIRLVPSAEMACVGVYGKHKLFHQIKNGSDPKKFSGPLLLELEIKQDGTLISDYHFEERADGYVETAVFSQDFPQLTYFSGRGRWQIGCVNREPECERVRDDVRSYFLNTLDYLDIDGLNSPAPRSVVAAHRQKVLACASALRGKIIAATFR